MYFLILPSLVKFIPPTILHIGPILFGDILISGDIPGTISVQLFHSKISIGMIFKLNQDMCSPFSEFFLPECRMSFLLFLLLVNQPLQRHCLPDGLHPTPPMGWSSWNTFFSYNSEEKMIAQVRMSKAMSTKNLVQSPKSRIFQSEGLGSVASAVYSKCLNIKVTLF